MSATLPDGILERAQRLADLHKTHRPTHELTEATHLMTEMLHIAVHGETWARPESPQQVWLDLLGEVVTCRQMAPAGTADIKTHR